VQWLAFSGTGKIIVNLSVNGCADADTLDITISNSVPLSVITTKENITCTSLGKITVNASGGSLPYQYALNSGAFQTSNVFSGLAAGVYLTITKDNAGALVQKYDTILNLSQPVVAGSINGPMSVPTLALSNYIVGQQDAIINLNSNAIGKVVNGFYVTNGTYAALSMKNGDQFAKKFGSLTNANGDVDGTNGNWTIQEGLENLYIINNNNGKKFKISLEEII
jgi:hypothetical protein